MTPHESFQELEQYFLGFPDFCNEKYFRFQKLILSMKILNKSIWQVSICFALKLTILKMTWQKVQGLKSKFGCFWLRWTCFGRTNCNSLFYGSSSSGHSTLGAETSEVSLRCVGSKRLISGWDKRSECALIWTSRTSVWSFSVQLFIGMLIKQFLYIFINRVHRILSLYNL